MGILGKFPSYAFLYKAAVGSAQRFPLTILSGLVCAIAGVLLIAHEGDPGRFAPMRFLMTGALGLPLFTALAALAEKRKWTTGTGLALQGAGLLLLIVYYFTLPQNPSAHNGDLICFLLFAIVAHFAVAFLPYLGGDQVQGFWQYNKSLFLRFLISALFSAVLFVGLAIALAALDFLFGVDVEEKLYPQLWMVMAFLVNTWIFLAGFPEDLTVLDQVVDYPRGLKVFAQYVLMPLVGLYLVILYVYGAKILIQWNWPRGWVSQLILWFSVVGILSLLLLWPLREMSENRWVRTFAKWFFRLLIPLVIMLFFAVLERVSDYGLTVNRYLVIAMAVGLAVVTLYFVISRKKDIRAIPIVIFAVALISALGPWSALSVAESSQAGRLDGYLTKYSLGPGAAIDTTASGIPEDDRKEMSSIVMYLAEWHGVDAFTRWLPDSVLSPLDTMPRWSGVHDTLCRHLGFTFVYPQYVSERGTYFQLTTQDKQAVDVGDYDYLVFLRPRWERDRQDTIAVALGEDSVRVIANPEGDKTLGFIITHSATDSVDSVTISLADSLDRFKGRGDARIEGDSLSFALTTQTYDIRLMLRYVTAMAYPESLRIDNVQGLIFFRRR